MKSDARRRLTAPFASAILNALDRRLAGAVQWGFYDLSLDEDEIRLVLEELPGELSAQWQILREESFYDAAAVVSDFLAAGLLYEDPLKPGHYRTRFAEGVRLLAKLRQMFRASQWSTAPTLVSDVKVHLADRRYPIRSESFDVCWRELQPLCTDPDLQEPVFRALASANGDALRFAGFQRRAFADILGQSSSPGLSGSVVSAGTGSGKTKAFYIPAFLRIVADLRKDPRPYTKIVAIYPRNVLLADQLREALAEAAKLRAVMEAAGLRPLTFGALLGDTPPSISSFEPQRPGSKSYIEEYSKGWKRRRLGWEVPFLRSPERANEALVWRDVDRKSGRTCLFEDAADGSPAIPDGVLRLTRDQIQSAPPDVLFLSLEMLNQQMGNPKWACALGLSHEVPPPRLLLLDEVHSYEGVAGAQAAWVLRRWRHRGRINDIHVVGLSATLRDASRHLGLVSGVPERVITEHRPFDEEMEAVDLEYNVAVKGNPAGGASLLATTIQTAMLLPRLLTPRTAPHSRSSAVMGDRFFGRKVFGFTDKLDVLNRWFADLRDAEVRKRLPALRQPTAVSTPAEVAREREGQSWKLPVELGHHLSNQMAVSRCSSQDPGANSESDVIVATASLEVGFDDPEVGATLHHKRPRSLASFIQRKGRAGRRRGTRPWTVVVLSDYGGDRWAFQNTETLFHPEIGSINLPLANSHVLRMQSVYFLIEWIGARVGLGNPYDYLRPGRKSGQGQSPAQLKALRLLNELLAFGELWDSFQRDFKALFRFPHGRYGPPIEDDVLDAVLWDAPRPLISSAIPTLIRKLESVWTFADPNRQGQIEDAFNRRPLPQFIPSATFAELDVGEARLVFPGTGKREEFLAVGRTLLETCPGNVSKRYSVRDGEQGYWLAFSLELAQKTVPPPEVAAVERLYPDRLFLETVSGVEVFEPISVPVVAIDPRLVRDTSKASWMWNTHVRPWGSRQAVPVLSGRQWQGVIRAFGAYMHRDHGRLDVLRYSQECRYELRRPDGRSVVGRLRLESERQVPADGAETEVYRSAEAVGFRKLVDGIEILLESSHLDSLPTPSAQVMTTLRADYFRHRVRQAADLSDEISVFVRDWLSQMSLAMLTATAARASVSIAEAQGMLAGKRAGAAQKVLESIFQVRDVDELGDEEKVKLKRRLEDLWSDQLVVSAIEQHERVLWDDVDAHFSTWARRRYVATIAQAIRSAAVARVADVTEDDLALDVVWTPDDASAAIFLTETESGGVGVVERIVAELRRRPDVFDEGVRHHLRWCPREDLITNLRGIVDVVSGAAGIPQSQDGIADAFADVRNSETVSAAEDARHALQLAVDSAGFVPTRQLLVALMTRLLQPGTGPDLDRLFRLFNIERDRLEVELGVEFGAEAFSYHAQGVDSLSKPLTSMLADIGGVSPTPYQLYAIAQRMALETCRHSCPECLDQPNLFNDFGRPSRALAAEWLALTTPEIRATADDDWIEALTGHLAVHGRVRLVVPSMLLDQAVARIQRLLADEIPVEYLLSPVSIVRVDRRHDEWSISFELKEAALA